MKKLSILTLLNVVFLFSCKNKDFKDFEGTWKGTYTGEDQGSWTMEIDEEGDIEGSARSDDFPGFPISIEGSVSKEGELNVLTNSAFFDLTFEGKINGEKASGTWISESDSSGTTVAIEGTWSGSKD